MTTEQHTTSEYQRENERLRQRIAELEAELEQTHRVEPVTPASKKTNHFPQLPVTAQIPEFQIIFDAIPDAVIFADINRVIQYVNPAMTRVFGYSPEELVGKSVQIIYVNTEDYFEQGRVRYNATAEIISKPYEILYRRKDGSMFFSESVGTAVRDNLGNYLGNLAIIRDVSQRKLIENRLADSESRLAAAQRLAHLGHWVWNLSQKELFWSNELYRILGLVPGEIEATYQDFLSFIHPDDRDLVEDTIEASLFHNTPYSIDHRIVQSNGEVRLVHAEAEVSYDAENNPIQIIGTIHDITELKEMENTVRRSQQLLEGTLSALRDIVWSVNYDSKKLTFVNPAIENIYGLPADSFYADNMLWFKMIHPEDQAMVIEAARQQKLTGYTEIEYRIVRPDQQVRWIYERSRIIYDDDTGKPLRTDSIATDITARKHAETELQKTATLLAISRDALRRLIEQLPIGIQVFDRDGLCVDANKAHFRIFGVKSRNEIVNVYNIFQDPLAQEVGTHLAAERALKGATAHLGDLHFDFQHGDPRYAHTKGKRIINVTIFPLYDHEHNVVNIVGVNHDVTERREAERQQLELAVKSERVRVLEELISDISHDFKTPISIISTNLYLLKKNVPANLVKYVERSELHINRLAKLIDGLLTISRLNQELHFQMKPINLNALLGDLADMKEPVVAAKKQSFRLRFTPLQAIVMGNSDELVRVFENLVDNAINYTPEGGTVTLHLTIDEAHIRIEITDTGIGINADELERIFDRFYRSDKARATHTGGSGLGLAIVKKIVELHGGTIEVESEPDHGSTFRVLLPKT